MYLPIAVSEAQLKEIKRQGPGMQLNVTAWNQEPSKYVPKVAIIGIGALAGGHRLTDLRGSEIDPIKREMEEMLSITKKMVRRTGGAYYPVGDICNRLFVADLPPHSDQLGIDPGDVDRLRELVASVNSLLIAVTEEQLRKIDFVVAIAGGRVKYNAILSVLMREKPVIDVLCTEAQMAQRLLRGIHPLDLS